ncbi:IS5 family transposase [Sphingomonas elodea]|uniref:IS5 family transposase n=1 Tax=Sphingomonas elodea TaxID=179878 RepID=UPI00192CC68F|nr:IS5 family transposase [Sphingomonas elodea]
MPGEFWLNDEQWDRLRPLLPNKPRGVPRVDDRRVISGIVHVLQAGCRWKDASSSYGPYKTLYNRHKRWSEKGVWQAVFEALAAAGGPPAEVLIDSTHVKAHRSAAGGKGGRTQAIGISRGGRNTKIHAIADAQGKPLAFLLTPGQAADCRAAEALLDALPARCIVHADRAYDTNRIRDLIERQGAVPNIPPKANRRWKSCFNRSLYKGRNAIERMFCRLKDCRRLATRYDRTAAIFLGSIHLAATVMWFL